MTFHRCVKLNKFSKEKAITFTPPDGEFQLMSYVISNNLATPFKVITFYSKNEGGIEIKIKLKASFPQNFTGQNIILGIPVPIGCEKANLNTGVGKAKLEPNQNLIFWRIKKLQGQREAMMRVYLNTDTELNDNSWRKTPLNLEFQIPMWTSSGISVSFLKVVESSGYKSHKWIRYLSESGEYSFRSK
jgi:AP-2 complex subunit mu-1